MQKEFISMSEHPRISECGGSESNRAQFFNPVPISMRFNRCLSAALERAAVTTVLEPQSYSKHCIAENNSSTPL
jgi:hypothetical protein